MVDARRSFELKNNKGIRSLSAPAYTVRNNRTCFLRKIFAVNNDDLSYLAKPPMGETNQTVAGQNKSAAKTSQKQVNLWFKERKYLMDKLDKAEDDVYQRLLSLHKTKLMIEKARDASPDRSSMALYARRPSRVPQPLSEETKRFNVTPMDVIQDAEEPAVVDAVDGAAAKPEVTDAAVAGVPPVDAGGGKAEEKKVEESKTERGVRLNLDEVVASPRAIKAQETARQTNRPSTQANVSARAPGVHTDRAKTELGLVNDVVHPPVTPKLQEPDTKTRHRHSIRIGDSAKLMPKKSAEAPKTHAKRIEERILNEPFTYWTQSTGGKLIPSDIAYKRRVFPLPDERDDVGRKNDFLEVERKTKKKYMERFSNLCNDLQKLDEWNPLDEMREMERLRKEETKGEKEAEDRWKKLGMLRHWVRAFGQREENELKGLDPNSEEALAMCKYIRRKDDKEDGDDSPKRTSRRKDKRSTRRSKEHGTHRESSRADKHKTRALAEQSKKPSS